MFRVMSSVQFCHPVPASSSPCHIQTILKILSTCEPGMTCSGKERHPCYCKVGKNTAKFSIHNCFMRLGYPVLFPSWVAVLYIQKIVINLGHIQNQSYPDLRLSCYKGTSS